MNQPEPDESAWLRERRVLAVSAGADMLSGVIQGLSDLGARVTRLATLDASSRASVAQAIDAAIARDGQPDLVAMSVVPQEAVRVAPLADWSEAAWRAAAMDGLRTTMWLLQALGVHLKPTGGAVVMVAPSLSLVGAPELVALSTLLEGQRGLLKSVARQWGANGVALNWIAAAPRALSPLFAEAPLAAKPDMVSVALGRAPDPRAEIAPVLSFLASKAGRVMTGATLMLDGGEWMVP